MWCSSNVHTAFSNISPSSYAVMAALMAPWRPVQTILTTAGLVWRLQCLTWGMTTMRMSTMRMTMKTNLPTPCHSNKHSLQNHPHRGNLVHCRVCFFFSFLPPQNKTPLRPVYLYFCLAFSGVSMKIKRTEVFAPTFFCSWVTCTTAQWEVSSKGTVVFVPATWSLCLIHFLISHPTKKQL